jgi:hypothetical protein
MGKFCGNGGGRLFARLDGRKTGVLLCLKDPVLGAYVPWNNEPDCRPDADQLQQLVHEKFDGVRRSQGSLVCDTWVTHTRMR